MALTPQNNVAFLREVDDELRLDTAARLWKRWSRVVIGAALAALVAIGGYLWWTNHVQAVAGADGETLSAALADLAAGNAKAARPKLSGLTASRSPGYGAAARLALADDKLSSNDLKGAAAAYGSIAGDTALAKPFRDLATIREVAAQYDGMKPELAIARLRPLAVSGNPFFGSAGEMTAVALMRVGKNAQAGAMFAAIVKDETVPSTIRSRSAQMAAALGVAVTPPTDKGTN